MLLWWVCFYLTMQLSASVLNQSAAVVIALVAAQVVTKLLYPEENEKIGAWILRTLAVVAVGLAIQLVVSGVRHVL
jgi:hypothetical protein